MKKICLLAAGIIVSLAAAAGWMASNTRASASPPPVVANVPVVVFHEMNNGCQPSAATCSASYPESVSYTEMVNRLGWLHSQGYRSINLTQYIQWLGGDTTGLPAQPILITFDNGIDGLLRGAIPILKEFHYTAVIFEATGLADGAPAAGYNCAGTPIATAPTVNTEPGCPAANQYWDSTWGWLQQFAKSGVYQFSLEAGPSGHSVQTYDPGQPGTNYWTGGPGAGGCYEFYACVDTNSTPPETNAQYQQRVQADLAAGKEEITSHLGSGHDVNLNAWVVPYGAVGDPCGDATNPNPCGLPYNGPIEPDGHGWLQDWAASQFKAVFVETPGLNGVAHERYRYDPSGALTLPQFERQFNTHVSAGDFNR